MPGHRIQDDINRHVIASAGINHQVESMSAGPLDVEVSLDEIGAIAVHGFRQFRRFLRVLASCLEPADLLLKGSVNENVKGIRAVAEIIS